MRLGDLFVRLGADFNQYSKDLKQAEGMAHTSGNNMGSILKNAISFALGRGMFEAVKEGFKSITQAGVSFNRTMQTATIGFTTMLGSATKAESFLQDVLAFAKDTPFEFPGLLEAAKRMLAYGFSANKILPTLRAVGDASAALGSGTVGIDRITLALGQIQAKGKLSAEEMRQLAEAGVPAWQMLSEAIGKTIPELQKMVTNGLIPGDKAVQILTNGMTQRFGGMMSKMENTWEGVTSSIKDIWSMTIGAMTKDIFKSTNQWLLKVREFGQQFYDALQSGGLQHAITKMFGANIANGLATFGNTLKSVWTMAKNFTSFVVANWPKIAPIINTIVIATLSYKMATIALLVAQKAGLIIGSLTKLWQVGAATLTMLSSGASIATVAQWGLNAAMEASPIGLLTIAIAGLITAGILLWKNWGKVSKFFIKAWGYMKIGALYSAYGIVDAIRVLLGWIPSVNKAMSKSLQGLASAIIKERDMLSNRSTALGAGREAAKKAGKATDGFTGSVEEQTKAMEESNQAAAASVQSFDEVHQLQRDMSNSINIPELAVGGLDDLSSVSSPEVLFEEVDFSGNIETTRQATEEIKSIWGRLSEWWGTIKFKPDNLWNNIVSDTSEKWNTLKTNAQIAWGGITTNLSTSWGNIKTSASSIWGGIKSDIETKWSTLKANASSVWADISTDINMRWNSLKVNADHIWGGIKTSIFTTWDSLKIKASETWGKVRTTIETKWSELSTSANTLWGQIGNTLQTTWDTLKTDAASKWSDIKASIDEAWNSLSSSVGKTWGGIKDTIQTEWNNLSIGASTTWGDIKATLQTTWSDLSTQASTDWGKIKSTIQTYWEDLKANAPITWNGIKASIESKWTDLKNSAQTLWGNVQSTIQTSWNNLKIEASSKWGEIKTGITSKWNELVSEAPNTWNIIKSAITDTFSKGGYIDEAFNWGKNLVKNITEGIKSKLTSLKESVKGAAETVADFLGFSSPTKKGPGRFADEWAPNLIKMYASGITSNVGLVSKAASQVAGQVRGMSATPLYSDNNPTRVSGQGQSKSELHLNIGTLVADEYGLKRLEQRLREFRIDEDQREGTA